MTGKAVVKIYDHELADRNRLFEDATAAEIVGWAIETFGQRLCLTSSLSDAVLIDVAWRVDPSIEIVFLDTQYHFPETLDTLLRVQERYRPNMHVSRPDFALDDLWQIDTDLCCERRKVRPLEAVLRGKDAWLSGLRRADDSSRADTPILSRDRRGLVKINPIATWSDDAVAAYIALHDVPVNPLLAQGYPSIGCWPCTKPVADGETARAGRWVGTDKTECGLHL